MDVTTKLFQGCFVVVIVVVVASVFVVGIFILDVLVVFLNLQVGGDPSSMI